MPPLAFKFAAGFKNAASDYIDKVRRFERNVIFFLLGSFLVGTGLMVWNLLFNLYLQERGFDKATIGFVLAIGNAAMGIMAIPSGILTYYIPMKKQLIGAQTLGAVFFVCALFAPDKYLLYAAIFFALGSMTAMRVVEGPFIMRNSKKEERAYVFGAMFIIMLGGGMMGFLFGGALKDVFIGLGSSNVGGYRAAMCVGILFSLLGTIPYFFIREPAASPDAPKRKKLNLRGLNWKFFGKALRPGLIVSTGAGLIVQFMNLYFKDVFNSSDSQIGVYMSGQSAAMAVGLMIAPALSDKIGKVKTIVFTQLASLPFMVWHASM